MTPALLGLCVVLLGRSFYTLYVKKMGTRTTTIITWLSAVLALGFWSWQLMLFLRQGNPP